MKIFILEDDPKISQHLNSTLTSQGWSVQSFSKIQDIISALGTQNDIDVIILDRLLPDGDSVNSLQNIKNKAPQARIVILSSLDFPKEKAKWLSEGADEYMSKPFFSDELVARINLLKARAENKPNLKIEIKDLIIDRVDRNIYCKGQKLDLSAKEY
ncbi:MAG: response regulator transcription factor, partial [Pseudobdellovibrio sp.]